MTTVGELFQQTATQSAERPALMVDSESGWHGDTWSQYYQKASTAAIAMIEMGIATGDRVAILGSNRAEWFIAWQGAVLAGAVPVGLYSSASAEQCSYIADHAGVSLVIVENSQMLEPHRSWVRDQGLRLIVMEGTDEDAEPWSSLQHPEPDQEQIQARISAVSEEDLYSLIYTSGTTGRPKAVMLTHHNVVWTAAKTATEYDFTDQHRVLSYLPLCHIAEQIISLNAPMAVGASSWLVPNITDLPQALKAVRPHFFLGVPRVWEKMQSAITDQLEAAPAIRRKIFRWATSVGLEAGCRLQHHEKPPFALPLARKLVLAPLRRKLGFDHAKVCATSAAPIGRSTLDFFLSLGIPLLEIYGMSECSGPATFSMPDNFRIGKAGRCLPGGDLRVADDGEVQMHGPHVFAGYYRDQDATREAFTEDGWLRSGDLGHLDDEGFLKITGRRKEIIITAGGKNVSPTAVEEQILTIPEIAQAVVVGDRRKFLVGLLTLDPRRASAKAQELGSTAADTTLVAKSPEFRAYLEQRIAEVNQRLSRVESLKNFAILDRELSIAGGELTPTMKLKRSVIEQKYAEIIDGLYRAPNTSPAQVS